MSENANVLRHDAEFVTATVASTKLYFQHGLALVTEEFGFSKRNADSPARAGFVQACAEIHAADNFDTDLNQVVGERLLKLALAIESQA